MAKRNTTAAIPRKKKKIREPRILPPDSPGFSTGLAGVVDGVAGGLATGFSC